MKYFISLLMLFYLYGCQPSPDEPVVPSETDYPTAPGIPIVSYGGKNYKTVQIFGKQCWLKENLDIGDMVFGKSDQSNNGIIEKYCYNDDPNNCNKYGGLYQWDEALQYTNTLETKGLCPEGWHIPKKNELDTLFSAINNDISILKDKAEVGGNNTSGFSMLMSGRRDFYGRFEGMGSFSDFVMSEWNTYSENRRPFWGSSSSQGFGLKTYGAAIRCIKDVPDEPPLPIYPKNNEVEVPNSITISWENKPNVKYYYFYIYFNNTDPNDPRPYYNNAFYKVKVESNSIKLSGLVNGFTYKWIVTSQYDCGQSDFIINSFTVRKKTLCPSSTITYQGLIYNTTQVNGQCWLKENLNVGTMITSTQNYTNNSIVEKRCYDDDPKNCDKYGGLYNWKEAMQYQEPSDYLPTRGICPEGWHLPNKYESNEYFRVNNVDLFDVNGFKFLLSGRYDSGYYPYLGLGQQGFFWQSYTFYDTINKQLNHYSFGYLIQNGSLIELSGGSNDDIKGVSVRCILD